jgi:hypothetical protein
MVTFSFLIVAWIVLLSIFLWDLIQHGADKMWMFIIIPVTLALTVTTYVTVQSMLGYPTDKVKEGKFVVISSAVKEPDWIFYWVAHEGGEEPVAYRFPYTEPDHKKQEAKNDTSSKSILGQIEWYSFDVSKTIPKD